MRPWFLATTSLTGSLFSNTNGPPSCIYLNHPVARDALTFTPLLVARGTRDIHEPLRALFFPPITTQDFGQVIGLDQSQRDMQTRLNSPGGPTLLLTHMAFREVFPLILHLKYRHRLKLYSRTVKSGSKMVHTVFVRFNTKRLPDINSVLYCM